MIQIIAGEKGKGKTKILIEKANDEVKKVKGSIVYLDKSIKHMYELSNKIRLINVKEYFVDNYHSFLGFISGMISQDHDIEIVYLDSFLNIAGIDKSELGVVLDKLYQISEKFHINFVVSVSVNGNEIPENAKEDIIVAL